MSTWPGSHPPSRSAAVQLVLGDTSRDGTVTVTYSTHKLLLDPAQTASMTSRRGVCVRARIAGRCAGVLHPRPWPGACGSRTRRWERRNAAEFMGSAEVFWLARVSQPQVQVQVQVQASLPCHHCGSRTLLRQGRCGTHNTTRAARLVASLTDRDEPIVEPSCYGSC